VAVAREITTSPLETDSRSPELNQWASQIKTNARRIEHICKNALDQCAAANGQVLGKSAVERPLACALCRSERTQDVTGECRLRSQNPLGEPSRTAPARAPIQSGICSKCQQRNGFASNDETATIRSTITTVVRKRACNKSHTAH
jgi:hypothetical protein